MRSWIDEVCEPAEELDSLDGVMWHVTDAWSRREERNVTLVHYHDLLTDLGGQMERLSGELGIDVPAPIWPELVEAATLKSMRRRADQFVPNAGGILRDPNAFFRRGTSGAGAELLDQDDLMRYQERVAALAPADLLTWLHR